MQTADIYLDSCTSDCDIPFFEEATQLCTEDLCKGSLFAIVQDCYGAFIQSLQDNLKEWSYGNGVIDSLPAHSSDLVTRLFAGDRLDTLDIHQQVDCACSAESCACVCSRRLSLYRLGNTSQVLVRFTQRRNY